MVELVWDGKYDAQGRKTAPLRLKLPFQTVETVNESAQERQLALDLFSAGRPTDWRNRLIWGDKKYVLPALLDEFAGQVDLIYIDPPFNVGADFSFTTTVPPASEGDEDGPAFVKEPSILEQKAYRDTWGRGLDSYLLWFYETSVLLWELVSERGSIYVHLDYNMSHYCKVILDDVFGAANLRNEIIWKRTTAHSDTNRWGNVHDTVFFYSKGDRYTWNSVYKPYDEDYEKRFRRTDPNGRRWTDDNLTAKGLSGGGYSYEYKGVTSLWRVPLETMQRLDAEGRLYFTSQGGIRLKRYLDELPGLPIQDVIDEIPPINSQAKERLGYPTQKPEALLERILQASSNEGDLVLDCFCGSGTTPAVAEKLGRRWIACDLGRFAIHTTRKRLLSIPNVRPFVVQNLGKYERQAWQAAEFGGSEHAAQITQAYRWFILELYGAQPIHGYTWLHGIKGGRMVHVGAVDAPISPGDVTQIALEFRQAIGTGKNAPTVNAVDVLGWDFAFELNEVARQQAMRPTSRCVSSASRARCWRRRRSNRATSSSSNSRRSRSR